MKRLFVLIILFMFCSGLNSETAWVDRNLYAPEKEFSPGTLVVVKVNDTSNLEFSFSFSAGKSGNVNVNPDTEITDFLPSISSSGNISSSGTGDYSKGSRIDMSIAARVTGSEPGGLYRIAGSKNYIFEGRRNTISVSGIVDPALMKGRTIDSSLIANFSIAVVIEDDRINITRPALEEDEYADVKLTEQEKRDIIIDYLERMLSEITR